MACLEQALKMPAEAQRAVWTGFGLPLLAKMYVRVNDIKSVPIAYKVVFQNKLVQAAELVKWAQKCCKRLGKELWTVTDGGFTKAGFPKPAHVAHVRQA